MGTGESVVYCAPDVDVDLPAHGAGLDLEPAGVAGHVAVAALHDRGQRDAGTHLHTAQSLAAETAH